MRVVVPTASRFVRTPDGHLWTPHGYRAYAFWRRYLDVYDELVLLAPVEARAEPPDGWRRATGAGVRAVTRPARSVLSAGRLLAAWERERRASVALHLRMPSTAGATISLVAARPFGVEVVGDPWQALARGQHHSRLRPAERIGGTASSRWACHRAIAVAYTTPRALQRLYPARASAFTTSYSSIDLTPEWLRDRSLIRTRREAPFTICHVASLAVLMKGHLTLLRAVAACRSAGVDVRVRFVGEGRHLQHFRAEADRLGLADAATFLGRLPRDEQVRAELDAADLFVLPTHDGGLPRALLEAMARGLPCLGPSTGGSSEVLSADALVPLGDHAALARAIASALADPSWRERQAHRNRSAAEDHRYDVLRQRRIAFYRHVREATEAWYKRSSRRLDSGLRW